MGGTMKRRGVAAAVLAVLAALAAGCLVQIHRLADPEAALRAARAEAQRYQGRPGPAHRINILVFDPDEGQLVRVSMPFWLARKIQGHIDWADEDDRDRDGRLGRLLARHLRMEDLQKAPLGVLADVEDEDGGQVLVWLR